jgi:hypothetical protein
MSHSTSHSPSTHRRGAHGGGGSHGGGGDEGGGGGGGGGPLVKVAFGRTLAEAEMIQGLLSEAGIPSVLKRSGFDVPEFLASGPHDVKVVSDLATKARSVLADTMVEEGQDPERTELEEQARLRSGGGETSPGRLALWVLIAFLGALILAWVLYQLT